MDVLFVVPSMSPYLLQECRGSLELARILKSNGVSVDLLRYWQADSQLDDFVRLVANITRRVEELNPRIVSFYCRCDVYHIVLSVSKEIKTRHPDMTILLGGPQAEISAQETLRNFPSVDYICCGEGETTIFPFVSSILSGHPDISVDGLTYIRDDGTIIQNKLPKLIGDNYTIDYNYYQLIPRFIIENSGQTTIEVGRGCPFNCSFCSSKTFWKRKFRLRDINDILDEVRYTYETYGIKVMRFEHDIFTADKKRLRMFCEKLIESGMPIYWRCSSRVDTVDEETILLMRKAGLKSIFFGIETGSERMQSIIHKGLSIEKSKRMLQLCLDAGVEVTASFMYGFPQETEDDVRDTLNLMCDLLDMGIQRVQVHLVDFLQGTELFDEYKNQLVFDSKVSNIATQFGISECSFIQEHPSIFSAFFNYPSELRSILDRVEDFIRCYMRFRSSMQQVRALMGGDAMVMYKRFRVVANDITQQRAEDGKGKLGLRLLKWRDFHQDDIKTVSKFYSCFDRGTVGDILIAFTEEAWKRKRSVPMAPGGISGLPGLVRSRLYVNGFEHQIAHIKRCGELMLMDSEFRKRFLFDSGKALREASLDVEPMDARILFGDDVDSICYSSLSEAGKLYLMFRRDSTTYVAPTRSWHASNQVLDRWRQAQIARCDDELGRTGRKLAHLPLAFELSTGCSVGCWFCGLSAGRLSGIFRYTDSNALLWRQCLQHMHVFLGADAEAPICYYATEPLDNPDLPLFLRDCFLEFHGVPQLTTAVPTRDSEFSKLVLRGLREQQLTLHRFSISSISELHNVLKIFSPEELLDVILVPRFPECPKAKLVRVGKAYEEMERTLPRGTIACVSGFVVNMENKSVRLVTPTRTCEEFPNGEIVVEQRWFDDADDLESQVNDLLKEID